MTTQESTEKVLRQLYLLLARGEEYQDNPNKIIVDKQQAERLLNDLNKCIYDMLENYEMTSRSRDQAEREFKRQGEKMLSDAQRRAEDVYAASIMYSEDSLNRISAIMREASVTMEKLYQEMGQRLQDEEKIIRRNQTELRSQLHALKDTDQYLEKMKEWREEEELEKARNQNRRSRDTSLYANRRTEVKVNYELLRKMNLEPVAEPEEEKENTDPVSEKQEVKVSGYSGEQIDNMDKKDASESVKEAAEEIIPDSVNDDRKTEDSKTDRESQILNSGNSEKHPQNDSRNDTQDADHLLKEEGEEPGEKSDDRGKVIHKEPEGKKADTEAQAQDQSRQKKNGINKKNSNRQKKNLQPHH